MSPPRLRQFLQSGLRLGKRMSSDGFRRRAICYFWFGTVEPRAATAPHLMAMAAVDGKKSRPYGVGNVGFGEAIGTNFSKYAMFFNGRARRPEYWYWILFVTLISMLTAILNTVVFLTTSKVLEVFLALILLGLHLTLLGLLLPSLGVTVRRLHDIDRSGCWILIVFLPIIGHIVLFVFMCLRGTAGPNRFGQKPALSSVPGPARR
jgi:uncharacterized membrane protein YhaH (DUF805 family)